jgi:hypothetical protein
VSEVDDPVLHTSSYETHQALLRRRPELADEPPRRLKKLGYKAQCNTIMAHVASLVEMWHHSGSSAILEGVHLHLKPVLRLMAQYPRIIPFLVRRPLDVQHALGVHHVAHALCQVSASQRLLSLRRVAPQRSLQVVHSRAHAVARSATRDTCARNRLMTLQRSLQVAGPRRLACIACPPGQFPGPR